MRGTHTIVSLLCIAGLSYADILRVQTTLNPWSSGISGAGNTLSIPANVKLATSAGLKYSGALIGRINLGTPSQSFNVILDTGSQNFWVRASNCTKSNSCLSTDIGYNSASSSSYMKSKSGLTELGPYGDGLDAFGLSGFETVGIAGATVTNVPFFYATNITSGTSDLGADGIMGIPAANLQNSTFDAQYVPGTLAQENLLDANIWAFWYNNSQSFVGNSYLDGELSLGGIDTALYSGTLQFIPLMWSVGSIPASLISLSAYWFVSLTSISVGSTSNVLSSTTAPGYAGQQTSSGFTTNKAGELPLLIDTGTTLTILPSGVVKAIATALKGKAYTGTSVGTGLYGPNCAQLAFQNYPNITFTMGGISLSITPTGYTVPDSTNNYCNGFFIFQGSSTAPLNGGILGNLQQSNYYNVFDWSGRRIGFARPSSTGVGSGTTFTTSPGQSGNGVSASSSGSVPARLSNPFLSLSAVVLMGLVSMI